MARKITVEFDGDAADFIRAMAAAKRASQSMARKVSEDSDRASSKLRKLGDAGRFAARQLAGMAVRAAPMAAAVVALGAAALAATTELLALGAIAGTLVVGFQGFFKAVQKGGAALKGLHPEARKAAQAIRSFGGQWQRIQKRVQGRLFKGLGDDLKRVGEIILPMVGKAMNRISRALNDVIERFLKWIQTEEGQRRLEKVIRDITNAAVRLIPQIATLINRVFMFVESVSRANEKFPVLGMLLNAAGSQLATFGAIANGVASAINAVGNAASWAWDKIQDFKSAVSNFGGFGVGGNPFAFAHGTTNAPGGLSLVGEHGPELVNLPRGSRVMTANNTLNRMTGSGGGGNITINVSGALDPNAVARQIRDVMRRANVSTGVAF